MGERNNVTNTTSNEKIGTDGEVDVPGTDADTNTTPPSKQELMELVRAIKFANNDWSQRQVHEEISKSLAQKVSCLQNVKLQDIKKVWKKAVVAASMQGNSDCNRPKSKSMNNNSNNNNDPTKKKNPSKESSSPSSSSSPNADLKAILQGTKPKVFTVGDSSQVYSQLAQDYTSAHQALQVAMEEEAMAKDAKRFVHVFLDVPGDKSGQRPHQALINFQSNNSAGANGKDASSASDQYSAKDGWVIVKIQRAAPLSAEDTAQHPMLLYNQSRTVKTFIHPHDSDDAQEEEADEGYSKIANLVAQSGRGGALGEKGGTKAYFYAKVSNRKKGANILSIQYTELAPVQSW